MSITEIICAKLSIYFTFNNLINSSIIIIQYSIVIMCVPLQMLTK